MTMPLKAILLVHLLMYIAIVFNILVFRQIIVFIYLSFVPGFLFLEVLELKEAGISERILFSVGLSIASLMFLGSIINELHLVGFSKPLSIIPLTIGLSLLTLTLCVICYRKDLSENSVSMRLHQNELRATISRLAFFALPPILGVVGALFVAIPFLLLLFVIVAILYVLSVFSIRLIPPRLYPILIFAISIALLLQIVFTSKNIIGYDANFEYYVFRVTQIDGHWSVLNVDVTSAMTSNLNSMLSITLLPTIYSAMLNISGEILFKVFYPFVFSLVPVGLYLTYARQMKKSASLLSVLFFISGQLVFYGVGPVSLDRQIVAEFFLVLSFLILVDKNIPLHKRRLLLIIFGTALAVSHYSLMYIYLVFILSIFVASKIKNISDKILNGAMVFSLFIVSLLWYSFSVSPLNSLADFLSFFISRFSNDILNPAARTTGQFLSQPSSNIATSFSLAIFLVAHFFIAIGILSAALKPQKTNFDPKYRIILILSAAILFLCFVLPNFAPSLNLSRFYGITLLVLAPCFVLGFDVLFDLTKNVLRKLNVKLPPKFIGSPIATSLICALLVCFLLTQSGFVNRVTGASPILRSLDVDRLRTPSGGHIEIDYYSAFIPDQNVLSAVWLSKYAGTSFTVYADFASRYNVLVSYGLMPLRLIRPLTNTTVLDQNSYVYLGFLNIADGVISTNTEPFNSSQISFLFNESNIIYSNGYSEIWSHNP